MSADDKTNAHDYQAMQPRDVGVGFDAPEFKTAHYKLASALFAEWRDRWAETGPGVMSRLVATRELSEAIREAEERGARWALDAYFPGGIQASGIDVSQNVPEAARIVHEAREREGR